MDPERIDQARRAVDVGRKAAELLENPLMVEAFDAVEALYMDGWRHSLPTEQVKRENCWFALKALENIKANLREHLETGNLEALVLDDIERIGRHEDSARQFV